MRRREFLAGLAAFGAVPELPEFGGIARRHPPQVNGDRLNRHLAELSAFGKSPGGTNRVAYSEADLVGRKYAAELMRAAGLDPRIDAIGNIVGRREGREPSLPSILIGSHIDSVTNGGNYDGDVGSMGAIEIAQTLAESMVMLRHSLEVVIFQNEEGGTVGSKLMVQPPTDSDLDRVMRSGISVRDGIGRIGGSLAGLAAARRKAGDFLCYLELHIEQGGILDRTGVNIGIVEGIVGLRWFEVTFTGFANHAGTTPMNQRKDAMLAAAKFTVAVNQAVRSVPGRQVATVGRLTVSPGTVNIVPGEVTLTVDLRDLKAETLVRFTKRFEALGKQIAAETGTTFAMRATSTNEPAPTDPRLRRRIAQSAESLGLTTLLMPSGAGHDAQEIARIAPIGMIFVPSVGGVSHSPNELTRPGDITNGANVLLQTVLMLDRSGL
ncbi:MAG: Zn-dependent hydrolase [Gemmatimonadales bacterium]|nr:Zn-dependent hydrolase [Gemmatimonadales bacterium]